MLKIPLGFTLLVVMSPLGFPLRAADAKASANPAKPARSESVLLWRAPENIGSRNLFYGPGGEKDQPHAPFTFVEEDKNGTNPKYVVRDRDNVKWTVKLGIEARPETVASRIVWAAGYFTNEEYFLQDLKIDGVPAHLKRGRELVASDGTMHAARLKRHVDGQKKVDTWSWRKDPLAGSRELNGLKVMMALINNWDLKDDNNDVYSTKDANEQMYIVSDLGSSFGATGLTIPLSHAKGDLHAYQHSKFITKIGTETVNFGTPGAPNLLYIFRLPEYVMRVKMDSLDKHIPRADAHWMGTVLAGLSADQIQDAFRAAGYTSEQVAAYTKIVQDRIKQLNTL